MLGPDQYMEQNPTDISIIIPVYNEQDSLAELHSRIDAVLIALNKSYEVVFIDDGSTDASWQVIEELSRSFPQVRAIQFRRNFGKSEALAAGFERVRGEIVFTMDADLQDDPKEIPNFIAKLNEGFDVVSGWKQKRHDPLEKRLPSKLFNAVTSYLSGVKLHDFNCGFKCYHNDVIKEIEVYGERHRFIPVLAHQRGFKTGELVVEHHARKHGKSKYGFERYVRGLLDLITLVFLTGYAKRPGHFFGSIGLLTLLAGFVIDMYIVYIKIRFGAIAPRYPLMFVGILLTIVGVQFITFGLLAELLLSRSKEGHIPGHSVRKIL